MLASLAAQQLELLQGYIWQAWGDLSLCNEPRSFAAKVEQWVSSGTSKILTDDSMLMFVAQPFSAPEPVALSVTCKPKDLFPM